MRHGSGAPRIEVTGANTMSASKSMSGIRNFVSSMIIGPFRQCRVVSPVLRFCLLRSGFELLPDFGILRKNLTHRFLACSLSPGLPDLLEFGGHYRHFL